MLGANCEGAMALFWMLMVVLMAAGGLMATLALAYRVPALRPRRIFDEPQRKLAGPAFQRRVLANMVLSGGFVFALAFGPYAYLFHERPTTWLIGVAQGLAILALYDVAYYAMHRFAFHQWAWLKRVHSVHHVVRHPNALDSLYLHPIETFLGVALLMLCTWIVGPVHVATFAGVFAVYSFLNILVHSGLDLPFFPFRAVSYLARKHDTHHTSMRGGNFASITPVCDLLFGTAE
jgi:sterol desaturase/sphingolipid hydroxylase (fatty acid hydroxylase superfamily)